jgi:UDP-N-acetylmuramate dehydrogenase
LKIFNNIPLRKYNTFGINVKADKFISVESENDAVSLFQDRNSISGQLLILGAGSNFLFTSDFHGTVMHSGIEGISIQETNNEYVIISAGSGVIWDSLVAWSVEKGYGGLENLSLIPGTVGASPVQNIGAYGVEAKDCIEKVFAVSTNDGSVKEFSNSDCRFGYRDSIFKGELKGKYFVSAVFFRLYKKYTLKTGYGALTEEVDRKGGATLNNVRQAVIDIRRSKLPDPVVIGNAGSFFKNPVVSAETASFLKMEFPGMPVFPDSSGGIKLAAGWLIELCGWKGFRKGDAGVHEKQALVIVNFGDASGSDIYNLSEDIKESVLKKFGVELEREVEISGAI